MHWSGRLLEFKKQRANESTEEAAYPLDEIQRIHLASRIPLSSNPIRIHESHPELESSTFVHYRAVPEFVLYLRR
jgi:hypothetical protein